MSPENNFCLYGVPDCELKALLVAVIKSSRLGWARNPMAVVPIRRDMGKRPCEDQDPQTGVTDTAMKPRNTRNHQLSVSKGIWIALPTP